MSDAFSINLPRSLWLFVILITAILIASCTTRHSVTVVDRSLKATEVPKTHVVIAGDTLFSIAWRYGLKYKSLAKYNGISPPYVIRPSQVIRLDLDERASRNVVNRPANIRRGWISGEQIKGENRQEKKTTLSAARTERQTAWEAPKWRWPVSGPILAKFQGSNALNKGIDLGGKLGEPVMSAASGKVVYSGSGLRGYGKLLIVKHNEVFLSAYAHNDRLLVKEGDLVKVGQRIADMGSSGADRIKLHFEIRRDGTPVDPLLYLPKR